MRRARKNGGHVDPPDKAPIITRARRAYARAADVYWGTLDLEQAGPGGGRHNREPARCLVAPIDPGWTSGMSGFSLSSEPFTLLRDCNAVMVPQGEMITLPAGQIGYITQALGGSFTVYVEGNLFRIAGQDADALGKESPPPIEVPADATDADVEKLAW